MTPDEIRNLAIECGLNILHSYEEELTAYTAAVEARERERCEKLHDTEDVLAPIGNSSYGECYQDGWIDGTSAYVKAIRASK